MYISSSKCPETEINTVARDWNFYFKKTSLGTGFSACNCLLDSRNCLLVLWYWVPTINWIGQKGRLQFIGSLGHYFTPALEPRLLPPTWVRLDWPHCDHDWFSEILRIFSDVLIANFVFGLFSGYYIESRSIFKWSYSLWWFKEFDDPQVFDGLKVMSNEIMDFGIWWFQSLPWAKGNFN